MAIEINPIHLHNVADYLGLSSDATLEECVNAADSSKFNSDYKSSSDPKSPDSEAWTATTNDSWVSISKTSGTGSDVISVYIESNSNSTGRNTQVTVSLDNHSSNDSCDISQSEISIPLWFD